MSLGMLSRELHNHDRKMAESAAITEHPPDSTATGTNPRAGPHRPIRALEGIGWLIWSTISWQLYMACAASLAAEIRLLIGLAVPLEFPLTAI